MEEAKAKSLVQKVKRLKEKKEKKVVEERRASEKERELTENEQRRKANKEKMRMVGGREPANRPPGPIWVSAVACAFASVAFYYLTIQTSDGIVEYVKDAFGNLGPTYAKSGLVSLTVGTGVVLSSVFAFSAIILILIGAQETKRFISNEPVVYFRCCGCDDKCCQNGPHNKGYSTRFIYRNDGRGYETRSAERMRAFTRLEKLHAFGTTDCVPKRGRLGLVGSERFSSVPKRHVANERGETREVSIEMLVVN